MENVSNGLKHTSKLDGKRFREMSTQRKKRLGEFTEVLIFILACIEEQLCTLISSQEHNLLR